MDTNILDLFKNLINKIDELNNELFSVKHTLSNINSNIYSLTQSIENIEIELKLQNMNNMNTTSNHKENENENIVIKKQLINNIINNPMFSKFNKLDVIKDAPIVEDEFMRLLSMYPIKKEVKSNEIIEVPHVHPFENLNCPLD